MLCHAVVNYLALRLRRTLHQSLRLCFAVGLSLAGLSAAADSVLSDQDIDEIVQQVLADELDYLKNPKKIKQAFEQSRNADLPERHYQAAAIYAELLFRQEEYDEQNRHVEEYLQQVDAEKYRSVYLLLLESKIRYLARVKERSEAEAIVSQLASMLETLSPKEQIIVYRTFAYHYTAFDEIEKTFDHAVSGLSLSEAAGDYGASGFFLQKISDAHNLLDEHEPAIDYAQQAVAAYEQTRDEHLTAKSYWSLGNVLLKLEKVEGGVFYFKRALKYFKEVGMQKGIVFAQYSIANIEHSRGNYGESLDILADNIVRAEAAGIYDMQLASMILKVSVYAKQNKWDMANDVSNEILPLIDKFSRTHYRANYFMERYKLKKETERYDEAFDAIEKYIEYREKHLKATNSDSITALQSELEIKSKEAEIHKLAQENSLSELRAKEESHEKTIWRMRAAIAVTLLIAFLLLFYWQLNERRKMHALSLKDELTKAVNRRGILAMAKRAIEDNYTIALLDLDHFKKINDNFGHDMGDEVLIAFAEAARISLRETDKFGRYGGEEWLFIINSSDDRGIQLAFERLRHTYQGLVRQTRLGALSANDWMPTFSVGAVPCRDVDSSLEEIIKLADNMLYKAKDSGRDQLMIFSQAA